MLCLSGCYRPLNYFYASADDELEIRTLVTFQGKHTVQYILDITPLNEVRFSCITEDQKSFQHQ